MPRLALNRKDTRWRIAWLEDPDIAILAGFPAGTA
jgi:hypothetical protein